MANFIISPNMSLREPVPGVEIGPAWANDINYDLSVLDGHNHNPGSGVQITPSGLNISADLPFGDNNATLLRSVIFTNNSGVLSQPADITSLYAAGGNLYYNNLSGTPVQITNGSSVNAGAGSIGGLPSGTASVNFSGGIYVFQSATLTPATIDVGSVIIRNTSASSNGITLQAPGSLASNYSITLPSLPGTNSFITISSSGNMGTLTQTRGITGSMVALNTLTVANAAVRATATSGADPGVGGITSIDINASTNSTSYGSYGTLTLTTAGNAVDIRCQVSGDQGAGLGFISGSNVDQGFFAIRRNGIIITSTVMQFQTPGTYISPAGALNFLDLLPTSGTQVYEFLMKVSNSRTTVQLQLCTFVAREIY